MCSMNRLCEHGECATEIERKPQNKQINYIQSSEFALRLIQSIAKMKLCRFIHSISLAYWDDTYI